MKGYKMSNRNRPVTARKNRMWTTTRVTLTIAAIGTAGQQISNLGATLESTLGRQLARGDTLAHIFVKGIWRTDAAATEEVTGAQLGIGIYAAAVDAADFPNLATHLGNWQLHDARVFQIGTTDVAVPHQLGGVDIESGGQRVVPAPGFTAFLVGQIDNAPSTGNLVFDGSVTCLWLYP